MKIFTHPFWTLLDRILLVDRKWTASFTELRSTLDCAPIGVSEGWPARTASFQYVSLRARANCAYARTYAREENLRSIRSNTLQVLFRRLFRWTASGPQVDRKSVRCGTLPVRTFRETRNICDFLIEFRDFFITADGISVMKTVLCRKSHITLFLSFRKHPGVFFIRTCLYFSRSLAAAMKQRLSRVPGTLPYSAITMNTAEDSSADAKPISRIRKSDLVEHGLELPLMFVRWLADNTLWEPSETRIANSNWQSVTKFYSIADLREMLDSLQRSEVDQLLYSWRFFRRLHASKHSEGSRVQGKFAVWRDEGKSQKIDRWHEFTGVLKGGWILTDEGDRKLASGNHIEYRIVKPDTSTNSAEQ